MTIRRGWYRAVALAALTLLLGTGVGQVGPTTPRAHAQEGGGALFIMADLVQGSKNVPDAQKPLRSCVLSSRFPRNSEMVWRARVFDPKTGTLMDDTVLEKVEVLLANGVTLEMEYGPHPPRADLQEYYWTANWVVPKDHPTGTLTYSIVATSTDGRSGEFKPFIVAPSLPAITDEVLEDISAAE